MNCLIHNKEEDKKVDTTSDKKGNGKTRFKVCDSCNKSGHVAADCRKKSMTCFNYKETGHLNFECPKKKNVVASGGVGGSGTKNDPKKRNARVFVLDTKKAADIPNTITDWAYTVNLPLNAVRDEGFPIMLNATGEYGRGLPPPSYHNMRVTLLNKRVEKRKISWIRSGHIGKNIGVALCPIFGRLKRKNAQVIMEMINEVIEDVEEANIVQFNTDNGSNFKAAGKILEQQHPKMFWTPCVALVDTEKKPSMGYIYDSVDRAKKQIKKNVTDVKLVTKLLGMIQSRWSDQLHHPLHAVGCYLNPAIFHGEKARDIKKNSDILTTLYVAIDHLVPDEDENEKVRQDLNLYIDSIGPFGSPAAIMGRTKVAPCKLWWRTYGIDTPLLQTFAMSVLSQTCSASPCERNWSTFDNLYTKKRNCLLQNKLNDLVYVQYNTRLYRRHNSLKDNKSLDPILLRDVEENDDWVTATEEELQEFVDGTYGLLWSVAK
ncbi:uncharacterized protein LOC143586091 [Bidens hawaiensis]|uniref:uncharacterized protein LOC143586091 n=1 Tax=Bidens hawaiensis TaxID=980011 RepID=UPI00404B002E